MTITSGKYEMEERPDGTFVVTLFAAEGHTVEPPKSLWETLEKNRDARYPFPQLKLKNPASPRQAGDIKWITIHHSAGSRATTNVKYWHRLHLSKGWSGVGYHCCIARLESPADPIDLWEANPWWITTWHDTRNTDTFAVTFAGDMREGYDGRPNERQLDLFGRAMAHYVPKFPNLQGIVGHKHWSATLCPGDLHTWGQGLISASRSYGVDITDLLKPRVVLGGMEAMPGWTGVLNFLRGVPSASAQDEHADNGRS